MESRLSEVGIEPLATDFEVIQIAADARSRFPLNFGGCFAYAHAKIRAEPLLTLNADFLKTDLSNPLHPNRT